MWALLAPTQAAGCSVGLQALFAADGRFDFVCDTSVPWLHHDAQASLWANATPPRGSGCHSYVALRGKRPEGCVVGQSCAQCALPQAQVVERVNLQGGTCEACGVPEKCELVKSFVARQAILFTAGLLFLLYTFVRVRRGIEIRDMRTFAADCSKQAGQQAFGGVMMVIVGEMLARNGLDGLAWYGAEYPFEIVLTTAFTGVLRHKTEDFFLILYHEGHWSRLKPLTQFGKYGPTPGSFQWGWYWMQMLHAVILIGVVARLSSIFCILLMLQLPGWWSPVRLVAELWFYSGLNCSTRTFSTLYGMPVLGDAVQLIIIDRLQKYRRPVVDESSNSLGCCSLSSSSPLSDGDRNAALH